MIRILTWYWIDKMKKFKKCSLLIAPIFLISCGINEPTSVDVQDAVAEYATLTHLSRPITTLGITNRLPIKYIYSNIEKIGCTSVGENNYLCSVRVVGREEMMDGLISVKFSEIQKFNLFKYDGLWRTREAIEQGAKRSSTSSFEKNLRVWVQNFKESVSRIVTDIGIKK